MKNIKLFLCICLLVTTVHANAQPAADVKSLAPEKREQYIQKASQYRKEENYAAAIVQLDTILKANPVDAGILLFKGDLQLQSNLFKDAVDTYMQLLPLKFETTITQINLSYALFMGHQPAKALQFAKKAWEANKGHTNAIVNYFNAMLWNVDTKSAKQFLQQQQALLLPAQVLVLNARLHTTAGDYTNGLHYYDSLVKTCPNKYYVQEYAEVLLGKKEIRQSADVMQAAKHLFSANEYAAYQQKWKAAQLQEAGTEFVYFSDVAKNTRIESSAWWQQRAGKKYRLRLSAGISTIEDAAGLKTGMQFAHLGITERWGKAWSGQTEVHLQMIKPADIKGFSGITGKQTVQYQPNDRRMVGLSYASSILNFTASLLGKNIRSNSLGYVTHIMLSGKTGFYSQGSWAFINDNNQSQQFFGSLYHLFRTEPTLKAGINFSAVHYKDSSVKIYFSPNRYLSTETFVDYSTALPMLSKFYFQMQAAAGMQQIEREQWNPAYRMQTELGFRLKHFEGSLKYQISNVAAAVGTGYQFNAISTRLVWKW